MMHPVLYSERGAITSKPVNGKGVHSWGITKRKRRLCRFKVKFSQKSASCLESFLQSKLFSARFLFTAVFPTQF